MPEGPPKNEGKTIWGSLSPSSEMDEETKAAIKAGRHLNPNRIIETGPATPKSTKTKEGKAPDSVAFTEEFEDELQDRGLYVKRGGNSKPERRDNTEKSNMAERLSNLYWDRIIPKKDRELVIRIKNLVEKIRNNKEISELKGLLKEGQELIAQVEAKYPLSDIGKKKQAEAETAKTISTEPSSARSPESSEDAEIKERIRRKREIFKNRGRTPADSEPAAQETGSTRQEVAAAALESLPGGLFEFLAKAAGREDIKNFKKEVVISLSDILLELATDPKLLKMPIEEVVERFLNKIPADLIPTLDVLRKENAQQIKSFAKDVAEAVKIKNKDERLKKLDEVFEKYNLPVQIKNLAKNIAELTARVNQNPEDKQARQELAGAKKTASSLWGKIISAFSLPMAILLVAVLLTLIVSIQTTDYLVGKKGHK